MTGRVRSDQASTSDVTQTLGLAVLSLCAVLSGCSGGPPASASISPSCCCLTEKTARQ